MTAPTHERLLRGLIEHELAQPNEVSCGAAALAMGRAVLDGEYARHLGGSCPSLGAGTPCRVASTFAEEVTRLHRVATSLTGTGTGLQLPWPRALGTPPWALAHALSDPGRRYVVRWATSGAAWGRAGAALRAGLPVGLYVGTLWLPRHVTLLLPDEEAPLRAYNPATGKVRPVPGSPTASEELRYAASWPQPWWLVLPR